MKYFLRLRSNGKEKRAILFSFRQPTCALHIQSSDRERIWSEAHCHVRDFRAVLTMQLRTSSEFEKKTKFVGKKPFTVEVALLFVFSLSNSLFFVSFLHLSDISHMQEQAGSMPSTQTVVQSLSHNRDGSEKVRAFDKRTHRHKPFDRQ